MQVRKLIHKLAIQIILLLFANNALAASSQFVNTNNNAAKAKIIASFYQQENLIAGLEVKINKGWKIYGPDDSGLGVPPSFDFASSDNIDLGQITPIFPPANLEEEKFGEETIQYSTYQDHIIIPIELAVKDINQNTNLEITVNYGLCKKICIPITQKFSLTIPSKEVDIEILQKIQKHLPDQQIIDLSLENSTQDNVNNQIQISFLKALLIAFIGGVILNIMPCVLPVLSIKLLSIINHSGAKTSRIRLAFLSTILGIVSCFLLFAIATAALKFLGNSVGWGLQFQNPYFLLFLLVVLMVFIANLLGLFEFKGNAFISNFLNKKIDNQQINNKPKNIFWPNFLSGILAVLLATPCSAPFVGVAISFALAAEISTIFAIFITMSLGLAFPYLFLLIFPNAVNLLPKPGAWMQKAKNLMAGFLAATAIWVIYILCNNIGFIAAIAAAILAILFLGFFKIITKFKLDNKLSAIIAILAFIGLVAAIFMVPNRLIHLQKISQITNQKYWIEFDQKQIKPLIDQGKVVVIDITASWCVTCKANKLLVLDSKEVKEKLAEKDIIAMRGDLTKPNQEISEFMKKYNRYGIPFNIIFGPNAKDGILTSELLSKKALLEAIEKAR